MQRFKRTTCSKAACKSSGSACVPMPGPLETQDGVRDNSLARTILMHKWPCCMALSHDWHGTHAPFLATCAVQPAHSEPRRLS